MGGQWAVAGIQPAVADDAWVAPGAVLIGAVRLDAGASVWYGAVVRADQENIGIGAESNLQDGVLVHSDPGFPVQIGARVTVGHGAILHGCRVEDGALIGMGARLLNGSRIGAGSVVGAGALVPEGMQVPPGVLVLGSPAKVRRAVADSEVEHLVQSARSYVDLSRVHRSARAVLPEPPH